MFKIKLLVIFFAACVVLFFQCQIFQLSQELNSLRNEYYKQINSVKAIKKNTNDDAIIIYNRVPKTGSTSFIGVAYDICKKNNFHVIHVNISSNNHVLSLPNQYSIVQNITKWTDMKPVIYHGHFAYLDFSKYSSIKPLYINIIRKPLDRLVSYYYFLRYGDNYRPYLIRKKHGDTVTFDDCVKSNQPDCDPNNMWLQIPFFCGHAVNCW
ncbi:heparan sulfate 2-o-sulfotransferase [Holotrichia oblita]|uniref:Heparan sulfate 2-o-sulfotransferase n=1 Tax=Holotrichia oblita TaxID=644536 RepID=A0ACB9TUL7_HOLOL|nr:heparan sulfate 2-o-sulfotransferase [Holotrichia oblita]